MKCQIVPAWSLVVIMGAAGMSIGTARADGVDDPGVSLLGLPGTFRTVSAFPLPPASWRQQLTAGFFPSTRITFPEETHSDVTGHYALSYRAAAAAFYDDAPRFGLSSPTLSVHALARRYRISAESGSANTTVFGDTTLGFHSPVWRSRDMAVSLAIPVTVFGRPGGGPDFSSISPAVYGLFSYLAPQMGPLAHRLDLNIGFEWDNSNSIVQKAGLEVTRRNRLAQGVYRESSLVFSFAYVVQVGRFQPFVDFTVWKDVDGRAVDSEGVEVKLPFGSDPKLITPGLKVAILDRLGGFVAFDVGSLTSPFPGEERGMPPWQAWLGVVWGGAAGRDRSTGASDFSGDAVIMGKVLDAESRESVTAIVQLNREARIVDDQAGEGAYDFSDLPAGRYELYAAASGYEPFLEEVFVEEGAPFEQDIYLSAVAPTLIVAQNSDSPDVETEPELFFDDESTLEENESEIEPAVEDEPPEDFAEQEVMEESVETSEPEAKPPSKEILSQRIEFLSGSAEISPELLAKVAAIAAVLEAYPDTLLRIQGKTTRRSEIPRGMKLSMARALAIADALAGLGIDRKRLVPMAFKESPAPPTAKPAESESGYVEFVAFEPPATPVQE